MQMRFTEGKEEAMAGENLIKTREKVAKASANSIATPKKIRDLQRTLYRQAKGNPKWRAWSLYGDLCRRDVLTYALKQVIDNAGAPGVDGIKVEPLKNSADKREEFLDNLQNELKEKRYKPSAVRRVYIPKANKKLRPLGIPCIKDRVVQTAVKLLLEPIFEADFHPNSFAYRPQRNAQQAIDAISKGLLSGRTEVVDADLSKYFDTIPHRELLRQVRRRVSDGAILKLIRAWLRAPIVEENANSGKKKNLPNKRGTPQGGVISPLLANLYLNDLDYVVNEKCELKPKMVRYADDLVILCGKGQGPGLKERLSKFLTHKGLELNQEKTKIVDSREESFAFLGFRINWRKSFKTDKLYPHVEPSPEAQQRLRTKVREILNHWTLHCAGVDVVHKTNQIVQGWGAYYHYRNSTVVFCNMQGWIENRLNRWLWRKQKCKGRLWKDSRGQRLSEQYNLYKLPTRIRY